MILETAERVAREFGVRNGRQIGRQLLAAYAEPGRAYHNANHIDHMLTVIGWQAFGCKHWNELVWAVLFHDAVYDSKAKDNEEQSAEWAISCLRGTLIPKEPLIRGLILSTKSHEPFDDSKESKLILDADLAILGSSAEGYREYADSIRKEYSWVSEEDYRAGRSEVLRRFLERDRIYLTTLMHRQRGARARRNLQWELEYLG